MTLLELSTAISQDLGNPNSPTVGVIQYWLRHNIFTLNTLLNTSYTINTTDGSLSPELNDTDSAILKKMYFVYYYDGKIRENLGAASQDPVLEIAENGAIVRMISKNNIALTYTQIKKQEQEELNKLITFYRGNNAVPQSIDGDDTQDTEYNGVNSVRSTD